MRARNLKPSFFMNYELSKVEPLGRILFEGLWCMADRKGRLEDIPEKIKASILPYDSCDIEKLLHRLSEKHFILRYQSKGNRYIQIINFEKHQYPHVKEQESTIPAPGKNHTRTVLKRLNPESPILNPESPIPVMAPAGAKPYTLPNPKTNPTACLVISYKTRKGVPYDSREWDGLNWGRCAGAAKVLMSLCKDLECAEKCMGDLAENFDAKSMTWTLETIAKHAPDWLKKNGRTDANTSRAGLRMAIAQRQSEKSNQNDLVKVSERTIPVAIRDGTYSESGNEANGKRTAGRLDEKDMG